MRRLFRKPSNRCLAALFVVVAVGCASSPPPEGSHPGGATVRVSNESRAARASEERVRQRQLRAADELETEFFEVEKMLGTARARARGAGDAREETETRLFAKERQLQQARQDLRDLQIASMDSFDRIEARLRGTLRELRQNLSTLPITPESRLGD